jgi:hypothetical protein
MNDEQIIEQEIQAKGLSAPRLSPADIDAAIVHAQYHIFPGTTLTVCCLTLRNGFTVTGESAAASPANFDQEIGRQIAFKNAREKVWPLEGYLLKQRLHDSTNDFPLGKACDVSSEGACEACQ